MLKKAIDYLWFEQPDKAGGFVRDGNEGGARAVEQLRQVMGVLHAADVRPQLALYNATDFENYTIFKPTEKHGKELNCMLDKQAAWARPLKPCTRNKGIHF